MISLKAHNWIIEDVECVLFDKDGTFIDLHYFWGKITELRALEVIKKYKLLKSEFDFICSALGYDTKSKKMLPGGITALYSRIKIINLFNQALKDIGINSSEEEIEKIFDKVSEEFNKNAITYTKPIYEAINLIENLHKKGVKLGVITSDSVESTNLTLKNFNWEHFFNVVVGRESSKYTKESGKPTQLALKLLNANPMKTVMIGDAPMDYISAQNAGIEKTILVATGQVDKNTLEKTSVFTLNDLSEIKIISS